MATIRCNGNWVQFDSHDNQCFEDNEEETLSLCDLPTNDIQIQTTSNIEDTEPEDFQFGSSHGDTTCLSPENMCNADDVFFQGQILPLRHSVCSETAGLTRSASMSVVGSRSITTGKDPRTIRSNEYGYKPKIRNQFHSHPSPSPQIRTQSFRTLSHSNPKTSSSLWSFLQVGLVKPQEIGLSDLKNRSKRFGSHNSNSSSNSGSMNSMNGTNDQTQSQNKHQNKIKHPPKNNKKKQRLFFGGCKCTAVTTVGTMKDTVGKKKTTTEDRNSTMIGEGRQTASRHRTFEWLKQLSIAAPSEA
ncbi:hypothetical protein HanRHA438_Chr09g0408421 [Helianthus annuus]|uniref:Membrane-associated kinase regulator n=1 Tax=Helianthus annuus TaxID=4232 RepID=A0A251T3M4_HELAN|nr:uncharacterized protein LOC110893010 [Helianthus annuus]KAF5791597.1 hypothetical protein HanXRQr2_Chr09g0396601 [Helianthus annuus]KAJ0526639.1 hypothetical protein HanHA300_Chr09g0325441 [Helianthus annuus]KAJ0535149.1 hypothetical protein HanIR_Chr09g0427571 [Helianthus annuus]KAJ0543034.1 hypothetical protein HanHA89_Chr09g0346371 [Helianthus annuus]KAJ0708088.1 hypothetical protein HanLR1_Chr09g0325691 [Helianthus annuus]